jgi:hypothetical protein
MPGPWAQAGLPPVQGSGRLSGHGGTAMMDTLCEPGSLRRLLAPRSVAVVGVSADPACATSTDPPGR